MGGRLKGKAAIVTGAASPDGMGYAIAQLFLAEGASVLITDIDGAGIESSVAALSASGGRVLGSKHDVTNEQDWQLIVSRAVAEFGGLDILVNNAGLALTLALEQTSIADFDRLQSVNLRGVFLGCREAVGAMRAQGGGTIVNMSSVAGINGVAYNAVYAASKGGVKQLTKSLALELAKDKIRCNSVCPGVIDTGMVRSVIDLEPENSAAIINAIPMAALGRPGQVATCVLFLASDDASYVTGTELIVDGGLTAQ